MEGWLSTRWIGGEGGACQKKNARGGEPARVTATAEGNYVDSVRVGRLSRYSHVLLLPLWGRSHADAGDAPHKVFREAVEFGGCCSPHQMWEM